MQRIRQFVLRVMETLFWRPRRGTDLEVLWPVLKSVAKARMGEEGWTYLPVARSAFYRYVSKDVAWTRVYSKKELREYVYRLR